MARGGNIRAGRAFVALSLNDSAMVRGLRNAGRRLKTLGADFGRLGASALAGGAALAAPVVAAVKTYAQLGDTIDKMSQRTGIGTNALSELGFAAEQTGSKIETVEKATRTMQRSIVDAGRGLSTPTEALDRLGLSFEQLNGLRPEQQLELIADGLAGIPDDTTRAATAMQLLGRSGQELLPLLSLGARGIGELRAQARDLNLSIDPQDARDAAELTDQINILRRVLGATFFGVGRQVAPIVLRYARSAQGAAREVGVWVDRNGRLLRGLLKLGGVVAAVGAGFVGLGAAITGLGIAAGGVTVLLSPLIAIPAGVVVAIGGLIAAFNGGEIAGINFGRAMLKLADDLGLLERVAAKTSQALRLDEATDAANEAAAKVAEAQSKLNRAETADARVKASRELVRTLEAQLKAQEDLDAQERNAGVRQEVVRRTTGSAAFGITQENTARGFALQDVLADLRAAEAATAELEANQRNELTGQAEEAVRFAEEAAQRVVEGVNVPLGVELDADESGFDAKVRGMLDAVKRRTESLRGFRLDLSLFGASAEDAARLQITEEANRLRRAARELDQLTPELDAEIEARAQRSLGELLGERLEGGVVRNARAAGTFDLRASQGLRGGPAEDFARRTAVASEQAAQTLDEMERKGVPVFR